MEKPLFWHQGLFLQPHHFQLQDLYIQSLLKPFRNLLHPHFWGVESMDIQETALNNYSFHLIKGEFLFADNTYVTFPGNGLIEPRSFDGVASEDGKPLTVYVGLKKFSRAEGNVTVREDMNDLSDVATRFVTSGTPEDVIDLYQAGPTAQIKNLYYCLKVFWETEIDQLDNFSLIPVARVERRGDDIFLSESFVPPSLTISSNPVLMRLITELRDKLASRSHQLEAYKREKGIQSADFGSRDMVFLLALRTINRYVSMLYHLATTRTVHPWEIHGVLRQLVGELSTFSSEINVMGGDEADAAPLPDYDHRHLHRCFSVGLKLVTRLLDEITSGPDYVIPLIFDGTYYGAEMAPEVFDGRNRFFLVFESEADPEEINQSLETTAKLGSRESLPLLIARALPGIPMEHLETPPQELPRRTHSLYFKIDHHRDQWAQVQKNKNLALYWDNAPEDVKAELMIVGKG